MDNTETPVTKEETANETNTAETEAPAPQEAPPPPPRKKSGIGVRRHSDGRISAFVLNEGTPKQRIIKPAVFGRYYLSTFAFFIFAATVIATLYYIIVLSRSEYHADCTDTIMWANASYESGKVYDPDFKYACFLPFGTNLIMYPFLKIFGLSLTTHIIGMTGFFLILTVSFFLMMLRTGAKFTGAAMGTSAFLALTLSSRKLREIFWGHTIYYTLGILFLVIAVAAYFRIGQLEEKKHVNRAKGVKTGGLSFKITLSVCIFCLFIMLTATDGISALSIFLLPFLAAMAAEHFVDCDNRLLSMKSCMKLGQILLIAVMTVTGILLNNAWIGDLVAGYQEANSEYSAMSSWPEHLRNLPLAWLSLLGVKSMENKPLMEGEGLCNLFYIINALLLAVIPIIATVYYTRYTKKDRAMRFWVWIHWAVTAIVLLGYICGILSAAEWRLTPIYGTSLILSILFVRWAVSQKTVVSRVSVILFIPTIAVGLMNLQSMYSTKSDVYKENDLFELTEVLEDYGLEYGYATFWNCNSITVISGDKLKVREVTIDDNGINKRSYQSSKKWFEDMKDKDEYFILAGNYENSIITGSFPEYREKASQIYDTKINDNIYHIYVYDYNPVG